MRLTISPQFVSLNINREHLDLLGRLKGIDEGLLQDIVSDIVVRLGLGPFADKPTHTYSGGTKRKLSLAMALIGFPPALFLDEPSCGMDPQARRTSDPPRWT